MQVLSELTTAEYLVTFGRPAMELVTNAGRVAESLVRSMAEYPISSQDIRISNNAVVGDFVMSLGLFAGNGKIKLTPDGLTATFKNLTAPGDLDIVMKALDLMSHGVAQFLSDVPVLSESFNAILHFKPAGGRSDINTYFSRFVLPGNLGRYTDKGLKLAIRSDGRVNLTAAIEQLWSTDDTFLVSVQEEVPLGLRKAAIPEKFKAFFRSLLLVVHDLEFDPPPFLNEVN